MAQITGSVDGVARTLPRSSVRPSWSYEIVTVEKKQDTGRVAESNILDAPRRRKRSRRQKEAKDTEMVTNGQAQQTAVAANFMSMDVNSLIVPDTIQGGPSAQQPRDNDVVSITSSKELETALEGIPLQRAGKLSHGFIRGQQLQRALSPLGHLRGPQTGISPISQARYEVSPERTRENKYPSLPLAPVPEQVQEVNTTPEGALWKSNHVALPYSPGPNNLPHDFERLLNSSTAGFSGSAQALERSRWAPNNVSVRDLGLNSDHSIQNAKYAKQFILRDKALGSSNTLTRHQVLLNDKATPSSLDTAVSSISPMVREISMNISRLNN